MARRYAVIGAGWAGLAAAVELTRAGCPVTLYEAGRHAGGRARSVELDGQTLDNGQHILLGAYRATLALMRHIGLEPEAHFTRQPLTVADNSGFRLQLPRWPAPLNLAWGLVSSPTVSLKEKLATALWMQKLKWRGFRLETEMSVADWLDQSGQQGVLRQHLWEPLCLAALNTPAPRASATLFANVLRDSLGSPRREDTDLLLPRADLGQLLPEPATRWLAAQGTELRFSQRIKQLTPESAGVRVDGRLHAGAIVAVGPQHAPALWPWAVWPDSFEPIATVYLRYPPHTHLPFPLMALHGGIGQWVVDRGNGLLAAVQSGHGDWEVLADHELVQTLHSEISPLLPGHPHTQWHGIIREKRATFSCRPGLPRPEAATDHPLVWLAGDACWADYPATLEGAVRSGTFAARQLLKALPASPPA